MSDDKPISSKPNINKAGQDLFFPITAPKERNALLEEAAKVGASSQMWTKDQEVFLITHVTGFEDESGYHPALHFWSPKSFDHDKFLEVLHREKTRTCFFNVSVSRANLFFRTEYVDRDPTGLRFRVPEKLFKVQRRKHFRIPIPEAYRMIVEVPNPAFVDARLQRKILDISAGGIAILLDPDENGLYAIGQKLLGLAFEVKGRPIKVNADVRYLKPFVNDSGEETIKMGVEFQNLGGADADFIAAYVFEESRKLFSKML